MLTLGNKLNRSYSLFLPFDGDFCTITILFNKSNSFIGFNLDSNHYVRSRNNELKCFIFNDLSKSAFASTCLDIRNVRTRNLDIKNQFNNILPDFRNNIHYDTNETIRLSKIISSDDKKLESCLYVYVFKIIDSGNDFIYCLAERQHIDVMMDKKVVRTSAIQLSTNDANEDFITLIESSSRNLLDHNKQVSTVNDIFTERINVMVR